jgi:hypothetical protein
VAAAAVVRTSRVVVVAELILAAVTLRREAMQASQVVDVRPTLAALTMPAPEACATAALLRPTLTTQFPLTAPTVDMRLAADVSFPEAVMPVVAQVMVAPILDS